MYIEFLNTELNYISKKFQSSSVFRLVYERRYLPPNKILNKSYKDKEFKEKGNSFFLFVLKLYVAETNCSVLERAGHINSSSFFSEC